jgi:hypothetical protein
MKIKNMYNNLKVQYIQKKFRRGFGNCEKEMDKGVCTTQNRSVVRGSNVIMSDFY